MNPRWRWLIPVVVPLLILLIAGVTVLWPKWREWQRLLAIRVEPVDAATLATARSELARLDGIVQEQAAAKKSVPSLPASAALVEELATQRGLMVVSSTAAQGSGEMRLSPEERSRLRQVTVDGTYAQVVAFAGALVERPQTLLGRIALDQPAKDGNPARWVLHIVP